MPPYQDPSLPPEERARDLVSRMTLAEKVSQMSHAAPAIERLDVPAYNWWNECLHGVARAGLATVFPQAIGLAATWDTELLAQVADAISDEARAKHHAALRRGERGIYQGLTFWSPNVNIFRDPRWGRGHETYGEDPYLTARLGVTFVKGLQGDDPRYLKLVATPKHFAVHSGPEPERHHFDARVNARDLGDTYLPAFEACVREGGAFSVMGAYNRTNGEPCCAGPTLLQEILRETWGFEGYVVSDCWAIIDIYKHHRIVETPAEASALAVKSGCDLNCGCSYDTLILAVREGLIDEETIDRAVSRLFTARFRLGMFDLPERVPFAEIPFEVVASPRHAALALESARESLVLLKNEGALLPLSKELPSIAVIGPNADALASLLGNYNGTPRHATSLLEAIRRKVGPETRLYTARGCSLAEGFPILEVIPGAYLRPLNAHAGESGLTAAYYANPDFEGEPVRTAVDPRIDFTWLTSTPTSGPPNAPFSVRWEGFLVPPVSGTYRLGVRGFDRYRLILDGERIVDFESEHEPESRSRDTTLEAGRLYPLRLEMASHRADGQIRLLWARPDTDLLTPALEAAERADVVVLALGLTAQLEGEEMTVDLPGFAGGDRTTLDLPAPQQALLERVHALGKPIVLVLYSGSALAVNWAADHVPAIVEAWYPGQAGGEALADILFGDYNPAGRLPVTFYRSVNDLPPFEEYAMEGRTYRYFAGEPLYPFGYGLSYTRFAYSALRVAEHTTPVTVSVEVKNVGERPGDEVVQCYLSVPHGPRWSLAGFRRLHLQPGESARVDFELTPQELSYVDEEGRRVIEPGTYGVWVGGGQPETGHDVPGLQTHFAIRAWDRWVAVNGGDGERGIMTP